MAGSIRAKHLGWELAVSAGFDPATGKRRRVLRFVKGSRREAEIALAKLLTEVGFGQHLDSKRTVGDLLDNWIEVIKADLSPKTLHHYQSPTMLSAAASSVQ